MFFQIILCTSAISSDRRYFNSCIILFKCIFDIDGEDGDVSEGTVSMDVVNQKGSSLPSTGGIGTTVFYVTGGVLVVGAGILLVTKRRANKYKDE